VYLQTKLLLAISIILLAVFAALGVINYQAAERSAEAELLDQAGKVRNVLMSMRRIYHKQFINSGIELTEETVGFLPAHAVNRISADYPNWDKSGFKFNNVSDRPRNENQKADSNELEVMAFFRKNPKEKIVFKPITDVDGRDVYLYARPIWIEKYCLKCHGDRSKAPRTIRKLYANSWNYKVGDLRGLLSIKLPTDTVKKRVWGHFYQLIGVQLLGFILIFLLVMWIIRRNVTRPLGSLATGMRSVSEGDYTRRVVGETGEFSVLSGAFNHMTEQVQESRSELQALNTELETRVEIRTSELARANTKITSLNERLHEENLRMSAELNVSKKLQQMVLPSSDELALIPDLDIACFMQPADEVGGDYYDVLHYEGKTKIGIGDVTGHGLESGVIMLMVQMAVRTLLINKVSDSEEFIAVLNRAIFDNMQRMDMDKNLSLVLLDYAQGKLHLAGQHEEVLVVRKNGDIERIDTILLGYMLGLKADITPFLDSTQISLEVGDGIVLYTDGITEAQNQNEDMYGIDRMMAIVSEQWLKCSAHGIQTAIIDDVYAYIGDQEVLDDITLLVIKRKA